ncbi:MAG: cytochrome c [Beijerinckiaceae bacterium]|nr:cytochrome c [Beijerinckiaceae bacterium]
MRKIALLVVVLAVAGFAVFWFISAPQRAVAAGDASFNAPGEVERGKDIFFAGGCASCHATPNQADRLRLGGGLEMKSPFGSFYAPNISPHPRDGIGNWTNADLANAMMRGVSPDGSHYYPAFPYTSYAGMQADDARHLMTYIRTLQPVEGRARAHDLGFPFNIRRTLGVWKWMFFDTAQVKTDPARSASWNRGQYLTEALAHCAECHSPRNALGALVSAQRYAGGAEAHGDGWVPNITPRSLKDWTRGEWVQLLQMGLTAEGDSVGGSMGSVVRNIAELPKADAEAMADYLMTLPASESPPRPKK